MRGLDPLAKSIGRGVWVPAFAVTTEDLPCRAVALRHPEHDHSSFHKFLLLAHPAHPLL
jgi:hypothetical protein